MEITKHKYTITEKDGFYIVKPLLGDKVDTNLLMDLKYFAKGLLGEFSDESKYDGFLFQTMEYAEKFGARIDNYVNTNQIIIHNNESEDISVKTKVSNPEYNIYFLYESILKIVNDKGVDFLNDKLAIRDLTRLGAFKELPKSIEFIVFNFILKKYPEKLYRIGEWNEKCNFLKFSFIEETGFKEELVDIVFYVFGYAYGWIEFE